MKTETKITHSPLPWAVAADGEGILSEFVVEPRQAIRRIADTRIGYPSEYYSQKEREANSSLIVRAVNSHADMLEALEVSTEVLRAVLNFYHANGYEEAFIVGARVAQNEQVIARAKGDAA